MEDSVARANVDLGEGLLAYLRQVSATYANPARSDDIARAFRLSPSYVRAQMRRLAAGGLVRARRGPRGGYYVGSPWQVTGSDGLRRPGPDSAAAPDAAGWDAQHAAQQAKALLDRIEGAWQLAANGPRRLREALDEARAAAGELVAALALAPADGLRGGEGPDDAVRLLRHQVRLFAEGLGMEVSVAIRGLRLPLTAPYARALLLVVCEALAGLFLRAGSRRARVAILFTDREVKGRVRDSSRGPVADAPSAPPSGAATFFILPPPAG